MSEMRRVLVLGMQRSGTSVTYACLRGHPQVASHAQEIDVALFCSRSPKVLEEAGASAAERRTAYAEVFESLALDDDKTPPASRCKVLALKTAVGSHRDAIDLANALRDYLPDVAVILTHRSDLAAQHGSLLQAQRSGRWHSYDTANKVETEITIDPQEFRAYATDARHAVAQLRSLADSHRFLELSYEDDIVPGHWPTMFRFLGLEESPVTWLGMTKVSPPPETYIRNYDALRAILATLPTPSVEAERAAARERATGRRTDSVRFWARRAKVELQRGRPRSAHDTAMAGLRLAADQALSGDLVDWLMHILEEAWFTLGDLELARAAVAELARSYERLPSFLILRAIVARFSGDTAGALCDLDLALAIDPHQVRATGMREDWQSGPG